MERLWDEHDSAFHSHQLLKIPFLERQDTVFGDFSPNRTGAHYGKAASHEWPHIFFINRRLQQNRKFLGFFFSRCEWRKPPPCFLTCRACLSVLCIGAAAGWLAAEMTMRCLLLVLFLNECALNRNPVCAAAILHPCDGNTCPLIKYMACLVFVSVSFIVLHKLCTLFTMKYFLS